MNEYTFIQYDSFAKEWHAILTTTDATWLHMVMATYLKNGHDREDIAIVKTENLSHYTKG